MKVSPNEFMDKLTAFEYRHGLAVHKARTVIYSVGGVQVGRIHIAEDGSTTCEWSGLEDVETAAVAIHKERKGS